MSLSEDVIYQLKQEEGQSMTLTSYGDASTDLSSGITTTPSTDYKIRRGIKLESIFKQTLIKLLGADRLGDQKIGDFEILIDKKDLPKTLIVKIGDTIQTSQATGQIVGIANFEAAYVFGLKII